MKYYLIDDCTTKRSAEWTENISADSFIDAMEIAANKWASMSEHDKHDRDAFIIMSVDEDGANAIESGESSPYDYTYLNKWFDLTRQHHVRTEYFDYWGAAVDEEWDVPALEIVRLARGWNMTAEEILEQIDED